MRARRYGFTLPLSHVTVTVCGVNFCNEILVPTIYSSAPDGGAAFSAAAAAACAAANQQGEGCAPSAPGAAGMARRLQSTTATTHFQQMLETPEFQTTLRTNLGPNGANATIGPVRQGSGPSPPTAATTAAVVQVEAGGSVRIRAGGTLEIGAVAAA